MFPDTDSEASEKQTWSPFLISSCGFLSDSRSSRTFIWIIEAMCSGEGDFQKHTRGGDAPRGKRWWRRGGESKPNLTLLLIYLILTAQKDLKATQDFYFLLLLLQTTSNLSHLLCRLMHSRHVSTARTYSSSRGLGSVQHGTEQSLMFLIRVGFLFLWGGRLPLWIRHREGRSGAWKDLSA